NSNALAAALAAANPGDVITLAAGNYALINGAAFQISRSGNSPNFIVIRGQNGVVLDGGGTAGNVLEVSGSYIHIESLTVQNGLGGIKFYGTALHDDVVRRVTVTNVQYGIKLGYS